MLRWLSRLVRWLLELLGLRDDDSDGPPAAPSDLFSLEVSMSGTNVRLNWVLPTPTGRQAALDHVRIEARVTADPELPWTPVNDVPVSETTLLLEQVAPGAWEYRAIVVDLTGLESTNPPTCEIAVPFDLPSDVTELTATLE